MDIIIEENRCSNCNELLTEENNSGWFEIQLNDFGIEIKVPVCNNCNLEDNGIDGAY